MMGQIIYGSCIGTLIVFVAFILAIIEERVNS